jgi:hypothetical protein
MKNVTLLSMIIGLFFSVSAVAADKVVVIPLSSNSGNAWVTVYDNNDEFIGFSHTFHTNPPSNLDFVVSGKNYAANFNKSIANNVQILSFQSIGPHYLTPGCTGQKYTRQIFQIDIVGDGNVYDIITSAAYDRSAYYSKNSLPPVVIPGGNTVYYSNYNTPCQASSVPYESYLYALYPNDPAVTGFKESSEYTLPLKIHYDLPPIPQ